jgi:hypothetical protein
MSTESDESLVRRLVGDDPRAGAEVLEAAATSGSVPVLVAAALLSEDTRYLARAAATAVSPRDRQLVALADAQLTGQVDLLDALVRDHLADHPDHLLASWIAGRTHR